MNWKDIGRIAASAAPILGGVLGGPAGAAVGGVVAAAFGTDATPDAVAKALKNDPQAALKLREIELRHKERLEELMIERGRVELEEERARLADVAGARTRDVDIRRAGKANDRATWMIVGDVVGLLVCLGVLVWVPDLPGEVRGILSTIAGFFGLGLRDAHQFEFGSSRGSKEKDDRVAHAIPIGDLKGMPWLKGG
jgi:hypothetical protein